MALAARFAAGTGLVLCVLAGARPALAAEEPLSVAPDPIVLDANTTATVTLANESGVELVTRASVVGEDGSPVERTRVVPRRRVLPAGATEQARIRGSAGAEGVSLVVVADP